VNDVVGLIHPVISEIDFGPNCCRWVSKKNTTALAFGVARSDFPASVVVDHVCPGQGKQYTSYVVISHCS